MIENKIVLDVFFNTEETSKKEDLGMGDLVSKEDYTLKKVNFYRLDVLSPFEDEVFTDCCKLTVGGESFILPQSVEETELIIQSQLDGFKPE